MASANYQALLVRAKKMAGALGCVPTEGQLIESFGKKGVTVSVETARSLIHDVTEYRNSKSSGGGRSRSTSQEEPRREKPVEQKPEVSYRSTPKHSANYGW